MAILYVGLSCCFEDFGVFWGCGVFLMCILLLFVCLFLFVFYI